MGCMWSCGRGGGSGGGAGACVRARTPRTFAALYVL